MSVFQEHGIDDVWGVDGKHVETDGLEIPASRFVEADLQKGVKLDRRFDLAVCLEVAEHLPKDSAPLLVDGLVRLAPAVLFSAAIPGQGGAGHVNEQWPDHWAARFRGRGYIAVDCIRPRIWNEPHVRFWYAQNTLLFVEEALLDSRPLLRHEYEHSKTRPLSVVHPTMLKRVLKRSGQATPEKPATDVEAAPEQGFEARLQSLDPGLFDHVPSETTRLDRISLLALHIACRETYGTFRYLEIGSHLGGSLQVLIADERCAAITSIDARPLSQPDARGRDFAYPGNSTERMLAYLRTVPGANLAKLHTVEASTEDLDVASFEGAAELCLIDAEHTHDAALRDARFCRGVVGEAGAIAFHDRRLVGRAIEEFMAELEPGSFTAYPLQGSVFVVELGPPRLMRSDWVARLVPEPGES